jgi:hypothetical protein
MSLFQLLRQVHAQARERIVLFSSLQFYDAGFYIPLSTPQVDHQDTDSHQVSFCQIAAYGDLIEVDLFSECVFA